MCKDAENGPFLTETLSLLTVFGILLPRNGWASLS